jgi:hypothetical protein
MNQDDNLSKLNTRAIKLGKQLDVILRGGQPLTTQNYTLFLEAICAQPVPATCVSKIISSPTGVSAVQSAMRFDLSTKFLNGLATQLLMYLQAPDLATIGGGGFLHQILFELVEPPFFWSPFVQAFRNGDLQEDGQRSFAWLLFRLISLPGAKADQYVEIAQDPKILDALVNSTESDTRSFSYQIKHILDVRNTPGVVNVQYGPGGRHDNDFVNFREISILPTADEIISTKPPFLRPSVVLEDLETTDDRTPTYLDNQFRLLREDMIYELREEVQIILGKKKGGRRRALVIDGLDLLDVYGGPENKRCKWGLQFKCQQDLPQLKNIKPKDRKKYFDDNRRILKHQSLACLLFDGQPVAFPTIHRDEDLLSHKPPIIILQFEGEACTTKTLAKLKTTREIKLVQIDTAVFSFEPVLKAIQDARVVPLSSELLFWKEGDIPAPPVSQILNIIRPLQRNPSIDLQKLMKIPQSIVLDKSQADSLLSSLTQRVSLIQGPPGMFILHVFAQSSCSQIVSRHREIIHWCLACESPSRLHGRHDTCRLLYQPRTRSISRGFTQNRYTRSKHGPPG